jgi:hypothetical protein
LLTQFAVIAVVVLEGFDGTSAPTSTLVRLGDGRPNATPSAGFNVNRIRVEHRIERLTVTS